jgi:hypothetical protein
VIFSEEAPSLIANWMSSTYVICGECGSTIYARDPESLVDMDEESVWLRCRNNCCGHVGHYSASDLMTRPESRTIDHTFGVFLEG